MYAKSVLTVLQLLFPTIEVLPLRAVGSYWKIVLYELTNSP